MVKKKTHEQEGNKQKTPDESAENKVNNTTQENIVTEKSETPPVTDQELQTVATPPEEAAVADKVVAEEKSAEEKLAEMQDKYIRLAAEFDNYRRRTLREKIELTKYAGEDLLLKILPVMDDFERALSHLDTATDCASMRLGIDLIYGKFTEFLKQNGLKEIEALNCVFDLNLHDAVAKVAVEEEEKKGKIVDVIQKGYYLGDRIIRHSKVVVGE
ncbi:MAG: nucleotide exchange factor GrpE [Bacteroidales bacterium]|nr:nucleotide exchange factor GrpE [Bacteroidales bacterium]